MTTVRSLSMRRCPLQRSRSIDCVREYLTLRVRIICILRSILHATLRW